MKKIEAIVRHHKLDQIKTALIEAGHTGMTITEVHGFGRQKGQTETYRGAEYQVEFIPKLKMEIVTSDEQCDKILAALLKAAQTGQVGDGKVFVYDLQDVVRIRTEETGDTAL